MGYKICVDGFGKIKHAEVETAPLTFFVGDNNSGKSYLLSLLWALHSVDAASCLFEGVAGLRTDSANKIRRMISDFIEHIQNESCAVLELEVKDVINVINKLLENNKDNFISSIFNSQEVKVDKVWVESEETVITIKKVIKSHHIDIYCNNKRYGFVNRLLSTNTKIIIQLLQIQILQAFLSGRVDNSIYLPAARTGFVLSKDIINKVVRQEVFDSVKAYERADNTLQPLTKPIIEFLNEIESLSLDNDSKYENIVNWIESGMMHGNISYEEIGKKEIRYFPNGKDTSIPLRAASAIVTELTPLLLLLKYRSYFNELCYEEPEMCFHPQLQLRMGQLIVRMVNSGMNIIATTHSDIILQHINNMCKLKEMGMPSEILEQFQIDTIDGIDKDVIAVYQFTDEGNYSTVKRIPYTEEGFQIPTFQDALLSILEQTSQIQDYEA